MDYKKKYLKYKKKYNIIKNNKLFGGNFIILEDLIKEGKVDNIAINNFHGSLEYNNTFNVPKNIYLIQSNICGIGNYASANQILTNIDNDLVLSTNKIIHNIKSSNNYTLITPNSKICDVNLSTYTRDIHINGFTELSENLSLNYHYFIRNTYDDIKYKLENFDIITIKPTQNLEFINNVITKYKFTSLFLYYTNFIFFTLWYTIFTKKLFDNPSLTSIYELGDYIDITEILDSPVNIKDKYTVLERKFNEIKNDDFFMVLKEYYKILHNSNLLYQSNIINFKDTFVSYYQAQAKYVYMTDIIIELYDYIHSLISRCLRSFYSNKETTLLYSILSFFLIMYIGNCDIDTKLSIILNNYSSKIGPDNLGIVISLSCLSAFSFTREDELKILTCQNRLSTNYNYDYNETDKILNVININLNKLSKKIILPEELLFNTIDIYYDTFYALDDDFKMYMDIFDKLAIATKIDYNEKIIIRNYLNLCILFDYLYNINNVIYVNNNYSFEDFKKRFTHNKFYRLLYYISNRNFKIYNHFKQKYLQLANDEEQYTDNSLDYDTNTRKILFKTLDFNSLEELYSIIHDFTKNNVLLCMIVEFNIIKLFIDQINRFTYSYSLMYLLNERYVTLLLDETKIINNINKVIKINKQVIDKETFRINITIADSYKSNKLKQLELINPDYKENILTLSILNIDYNRSLDIETYSLINNNKQYEPELVEIKKINKSYYIINSAQYHILLRDLLKVYIK